MSLPQVSRVECIFHTEIPGRVISPKSWFSTVPWLFLPRRRRIVLILRVMCLTCLSRFAKFGLTADGKVRTWSRSDQTEFILYIRKRYRFRIKILLMRGVSKGKGLLPPRKLSQTIFKRHWKKLTFYDFWPFQDPFCPFKDNFQIMWPHKEIYDFADQPPPPTRKGSDLWNVFPNLQFPLLGVKRKSFLYYFFSAPSTARAL